MILHEFHFSGLNVYSQVIFAGRDRAVITVTDICAIWIISFVEVQDELARFEVFNFQIKVSAVFVAAFSTCQIGKRNKKMISIFLYIHQSLGLVNMQFGGL